jgi:hypothetical protein
MYCKDNPIKFFDPDGRDDYYSYIGEYERHEEGITDIIKVHIGYAVFEFADVTMEIPIYMPLDECDLPAETLSNIFTDILGKMDGVNTDDLIDGNVSVRVLKTDNNFYSSTNYTNNASNTFNCNSEIGLMGEKQNLTAYLYRDGSKENLYMYSTVSNVENLLGAHEYLGHFKKNLNMSDNEHKKVYEFQMSHPSWKTSTPKYKNYQYSVYYEKYIKPYIK